MFLEVGEPKFRLDWPELLALIVVIECGAAVLLALHYGVGGQIPWTVYYVIWLVPVSLIAAAIFCFSLIRMFLAGVERPTQRIIAKLRAANRRRALETFIPIAVVPAFMVSCTIFKVIIQDVTKYTADPYLSKLDGLMGVQPWQISHALLGPIATVVIDRAYFAWFIVTQLILMAVIFLPWLARHRGQFLLTFVGSWIALGIILALLIPSVGPCYYGHLYHDDPYKGLMARLVTINQHYHLTALGVQDRLWADHVANVVGIGSGISAMPSMHVSLAVVTALLLHRLGYGWFGWIWAGTIWIGSFHLGWHYASDGIVSAVLTVLIWKGVAIFLSKGNAASEYENCPRDSATRETPIGT
jgi:hypothetical protein